MAEYEVFIPAKDAAATLELPLRSLALQEHPPARVTVLDDGSTDATAAVAREHGARVVSLTGVGLAAAQNAALNEIRSEFVAFLDADDAWTQGAGRLLTTTLARSEKLAAVSGLAGQFSAGTDLGSVLSWCARGPGREPIGSPVTARQLWHRNPATKSATLFRTRALRDVGGYRVLRSAEDYDLLLRLHADGWSVEVLPDVTCWRMISSITMTARSAIMLEGEVQALVAFHATEARRRQLHGANLRWRCLVAWRRALVRDAQYHGTLKLAPDAPLGPLVGRLLGAVVRRAPDGLVERAVRTWTSAAEVDLRRLPRAAS